MFKMNLFTIFTANYRLKALQKVCVKEIMTNCALLCLQGHFELACIETEQFELEIQDQIGGI